MPCCATVLHCLLQELPAVQRPYVLLLELSDSRSLSSALQSAMSAQLRNLLAGLQPRLVPVVSEPPPPREAAAAGRAGGESLAAASASVAGTVYRLPDVPLGESAVSMSTLALYLGYFSFATCCPLPEV